MAALASEYRNMLFMFTGIMIELYNMRSCADIEVMGCVTISVKYH